MSENLTPEVLADPIEAAKERLAYVKNALGRMKDRRAAQALAELSRLEGENKQLAKAWEAKHKSQMASEKEAKKWFEQGHAAVKRAHEAETALVEARRQVAEQREALNKAIRQLSDSEAHEISRILDARDTLILARGLLASPPSGVAETFSPEAKRQAWSLLEQAVEGLAPTNNGGSET